MKKFIRNVLAYLLVIALLTIGINAAYTKLDNSDDDYTRKFGDMPETIEIFNTGSSHGLFGFNYADLEDEYDYFNFALLSQYPSYDLRLLKAYEDRIADGAVAIIQVSYFALIGIGEEEYADFEAKNQRYYGVLDDEMIKQYDAKTDFLVTKMPSLDARADIIRAAAGMLKVDNHTNMDRTTNADAVANYASTAYSNHFVVNKVDADGELIINQPEVDAVREMVTFCKENGWKPVIVVVPYLAEYNAVVGEREPEFLEWFHDTLDEIALENDIAWYDYSSDERFTDRYDYFVDADHMNREGARLFTNILMEEVVSQL